ncbi:ABC transporter permease [Brockia lithotrophica]|uniref:ABC-2 type transport system permease protein n=1 Tax=Brockia lithotrophica TaxID=933949 RepID=A0A660KW13_9BACL|nr:ABC transporter permease [Brockia lithotrophica]RKQ84632.1 ABC-2 type transport system permease protein [Brockia lithotrophica]
MDRGLAVLYRKELADHIHSLRSLVLAALVALTSLASLFTAAQALRAVVPTAKDPSAVSVFLIAVSSGANNLPSLASFVGFLAPLLGLGMSFDAISSERNRRTLLRLLAQPIYRDDVILAKWLAALTVVGVFFFALGVLVVGLAIFFFGVPPEGEELLRFFTYLAATVVYVAVWISFGVLLSLLFRQPSTAILIGLAAWLYFVLFHPLLVNLFVPVDEGAPPNVQLRQFAWHQGLLRLSPVELYQEVATALLTPEVRTLGPLTLGQLVGAVPTPLPYSQSLILVLPHVVVLFALAAALFALSFAYFMRQDITGRE